jgi:hypothetical protein
MRCLFVAGFPRQPEGMITAKRGAAICKSSASVNQTFGGGESTSTHLLCNFQPGQETVIKSQLTDCRLGILFEKLFVGIHLFYSEELL